MSATAVTKTIKKPVPIILASNALSRLWPVSTAGLNYALRRTGDAPSPLQSLLSAILETDCFAAPTIFVQETALKTAIAQIEPFYKGEAKIIATRPDASSGTLCALAARIQAQKSVSTRMVFLPATLAAENSLTLKRYLRLFSKIGSAQMPQHDDSICFVAARKMQNQAQMRFQLHHSPVTTGLLPVDKITALNYTLPAQHIEFTNEDLLVSPVGPAMARAGAISNLLSEKARTVLQACGLAIDTGETVSNVFRPNGHFLTVGARISLADVIAESPEQAQILMAGDDLETVRDWSSRFAMRPPNSERQTQIAGNAGAEIICFEGRTLVVAPSGEADVHIPAAAPTVKRTKRIGAEHYECIQETPHSAVWRIEVEPGQRLQNECHFQRIESWSIVSGNGTAYLNDKPVNVSAGSTVVIAPEVCHQIHNTGSETLVLYEMRMGKMMHDDDRLHIPSKLEKTA